LSRGYLSLVLHWHLPFVRHPEHPRFLEEDWLFEAISETYLPMLAVFERLVSDKVPFRVTVSVSPTLAEMLRDELLQDRYVLHLERLIELSEREVARTARNPEFAALAAMYRERFRECKARFVEVYKRDLLGTLVRLQKEGCLELITSAATHSFLPLFQVVPEAIRAQIGVAVRSHTRNFGAPPEGFWLPECGYYPGVEEALKAFSLGYFFLESHGVLFGSEPPRYGVYAPVYCPNRVAAFGRDPESAKAVWSSEEGYPGDPAYREFYRDIGFELPFEDVQPFVAADGIRAHTGIKYYAITGPGDDKVPYNRERALQRVQQHADHFLQARLQQVERLAALMDLPPIVVCPFDAELFGHWWFEGPEWIEALARKAASAGERLEMIHPMEYVRRHSDLQTLQPCFSSWGNKGYAEVWLEGSNDWIYRHLHMLARRMEELARRFPNERGVRRRALDQAFKEMLLAHASDWAFIMKTGTTVPYAVRRTREHIHNFNRLYDSVMANEISQEWLIDLEKKDNLFPDIDYRTYLSSP
jgi:1,4-alpha-glucan branching enzyme